MDHDELYEQLIAALMVPTVFPLASDILRPYAQLLADEGFPAIEVLARPLDKALEVFQELTPSDRRLIKWGMGTVCTRSAAQQAVEYRPDFIVSPAFSRRVFDVAANADIPYIPGVHSFQDVQNVIDHFEERGMRVRLLKLCPVFDITVEYLRSLRGCFPDIHFCPTGGISFDNYAEWKSIPGIVAPMSSQFVPQQWIEERCDDDIRQRLGQIRVLAG